MALRKLLAQVHLWAGLAALLILIPVGLTGIVLVWPTQFNAMMNPAPHASGAATLAPSAYYEAGMRALGAGARVETITFPVKEGQPVSVATAQRRGPPQRGSAASVSGQAWLEPATAEFIKSGPLRSPLFGVMHQLHENLLVRGWGRTVVGLAGIVMFGLCLSGIWLWWPRGAFAKGFAFRRTASTALNFHYMTGFWISIPLAIVALTGVGLSFPALLNGGQAGERPMMGERPPGGPGERPAAPAPSAAAIDAAAAAATQAAPGSQIASISLRGANQSWTVTVIDGGALKTLEVDDSGVVTPVKPREPRSGLMSTVRSLHEGAGNPVWKWLVTLTGIAPTLLGLTGLYVWLKAQLRKSRRTA